MTNNKRVTLTALKYNNFSRLFVDEEYGHPTPEDIRALRKFMKWSQHTVARIVGVSYNDDTKRSATVIKWETPVSNKTEHRKIPYAAWRLLLVHAGVVKK